MKKSISCILIVVMVTMLFSFVSYGNSTNQDWTLQNSVERNTTEADIVARTGDIDNFNFGWPENYTPFSGESTPSHSYPWKIDPNDAEGTDRIIVVSSYNGNPPHGQDGYTSTTNRPQNAVSPINIKYDIKDTKVNSASLQIFVDDFQSPVWGTNYTAFFNGVRAPFIENALNQLDQTGPIGKLLTMNIPQNFMEYVKKGNISILIDDKTTGAGDGYVIDFARILINPKKIVTNSISGIVTDKITNKPLQNVELAISSDIKATSDAEGKYKITGVSAGFNSVTASKVGYKNETKIIEVNSELNETLNFELMPRIDLDKEADIIAITGDIDNFNFGWPEGYNPFSGESTPSHSYPWKIDPNDAKGTDRIMVVSSYNGNPPKGQDGYTSTTGRPDNNVSPIEINYEIAQDYEIKNAYLQIFVDDFQSPIWGTKYIATLDGQRVPELETIINTLDQTGPIGKLITFKIPSMYYPLLNDGKLNILFDDNVTRAGDGYAIDFVRLLINKKEISHKGNIVGTITDIQTKTPIKDAIVTIAGEKAITDENGKYSIKDVHAGLGVVVAHKKGYVQQSGTIDILEDKVSSLDLQLIKKDINWKANVVTIQYLNPLMSIDGIEEEIDEGRGTKPIIKDGRMLLPLRSVVEAFGGTIEWIAEQRKIVIKIGTTEISLILDNKNAEVNGIAKELEVAPTIDNGRTFIPIRFVAESLDLNVDWNNDAKCATINRNK